MARAAEHVTLHRAKSAPARRNFRTHRQSREACLPPRPADRRLRALATRAMALRSLSLSCRSFPGRAGGLHRYSLRQRRGSRGRAWQPGAVIEAQQVLFVDDELNLHNLSRRSPAAARCRGVLPKHCLTCHQPKQCGEFAEARRKDCKQLHRLPHAAAKFACALFEHQRKEDHATGSQSPHRRVPRREPPLTESF